MFRIPRTRYALVLVYTKARCQNQFVVNFAGKQSALVACRGKEKEEG